MRGHIFIKVMVIMMTMMTTTADNNDGSSNSEKEADDDDRNGDGDDSKIKNKLISKTLRTHLRTVNTRAIFPMARILLRMTSFLLIASLCSSSSSPSSSSSVQMLRMFTSISVTKSGSEQHSFCQKSTTANCLKNHCSCQLVSVASVLLSVQILG